MTDYFEILDRDGAARIGEFRLADPVTTPARLDDVLVDSGSLWNADREAPDGDERELTILPHRSLPAGTRDEVQDAFATDHADTDFPTAAVVASDDPTPQGADAYILSDASGFVGHGGGSKTRSSARRTRCQPTPRSCFRALQRRETSRCWPTPASTASTRS